MTDYRIQSRHYELQTGRWIARVRILWDVAGGQHMEEIARTDGLTFASEQEAESMSVAMGREWVSHQR